MVHKKMSLEEYFKILTSELNKQKEMRATALMVHLLVEYQVNELLTCLLKNPEVIFKDIDLNYLSKKLKILEALGAFKIYKKLMKNIILINRIRNAFTKSLS